MHTKLLFILVCSAYAQANLPEDAKLDFKRLAVKYGGNVEEFNVITEDGYILKLFRIVGDKRKPVLILHGMMDSSDGPIIRGNLSLAVNLARNGYDVWVINHRGNKYSRRHQTLNPDKDPQFWNFYVHEYGTKDLPATIDFIIEKTGSKVNLIGYSQGTTTGLVLGATKPEYNEKINIFIAMAPICFLQNTRALVPVVLKLAPDFNKGLTRSRTEELFAFNSPIKAIMEATCRLKGVAYTLCMDVSTFPLTGVDAQQFEPDFLPIWVAHFPAGTSRKNVHHLSQLSSTNKFAQYDYGAKKNMQKYGSTSPPEYDLSKVTMKIAIFVAKNDPIATIEDVELLRKRLPNVVDYRIMEYNSFNHIDFIWGKTTYTDVLPKVLDILKKYNS